MKIDRAGLFIGDPILDTLVDAAAVLRWISSQNDVAASGIDTLLAWSLAGRRACDDWLRSTYQGRGGESVISQNSLYSSMTINGIMVAKSIAPPLCESHPKLLRKVGLLPEHFEPWFDNLQDHSFDALVAARCASRWHYRDWALDLFESDGDALVLPAGDAVYPWP